jgi:selenocysteine-specific translation elongation factor
VSKAEFARRVKRSAGRVSQWLSEGKIGGEAVAHTAEGDRIVLEVAVAQLGISLDVSQQLAQEQPILPGVGKTAAPASGTAESGADTDDAEPANPVLQDLQHRQLVAKVQADELKAEEARRKAMEANGRWVRADDVRAAWSRTLADVMTRFENEMPRLAEALASEMKVDVRAATIVLRREFRNLRAKLGAEASRERDARTVTSDDVPAAA